MSLRQTHPNFWLVIVGDVIAFAGLGWAFTFVTNTSPAWRYTEQVAPLRVFGVAYLVLCAALVAGLWWSPRLFRAALAGGVGVTSIFCLGLAASVAVDVWQTGAAPGAGGPFVYLFLAICLTAQAREPRTNPDAQR